LKIARVRHKGELFYAVLKDQGAHLLEGEPFEEVRPSGTVVPLSETEKILPPVQPPNVLAIGLNYYGHAKESNMKPPESPVLFIKANTSVIGPDEPIMLPKIAPEEVDYEAELCIVIGRRAKNVPEEKASDYIFGYTCANDISARDCQLRIDLQWARAKSFDTFCPLGPCVETEIDPHNLPIRLRLNGKIMQDSTTSDLIFPPERLVSFLSKCMTLLPGTVILTGTPSGVGFARKPPIYLRDGDIVEVEIGGIGLLRNPVMLER